MESLLLAVLAGITGLVLAQWGGGIARAALMPDVVWGSVLADRRLLALGLGLAIIVGLVTGLAPALHASHANVTEALKAGGDAVRRHHHREPVSGVARGPGGSGDGASGGLAEASQGGALTTPRWDRPSTAGKGRA